MTSEHRDYAVIIQQLVDLWDTDVDGHTQVPLRPDLELQASVAIYGLTAHAVDCAQAISVLYETGHKIAAVPLIRTLFEDSVTAGWILVIPDAWKSMWSQGLKDRAAVIKEGLPDHPDDKEAEGRHADYLAQHNELGNAKGWKFEQRVNVLAGTQSMYLIYRFASGLTHAGLSVIDTYMTESVATSIPVSYRRTGYHPTSDLFHSLAVGSLLQALIAWDCSQANRRHKHVLDSIASELGISNEWSAKNTSA